jgi:hypothetical protein
VSAVNARGRLPVAVARGRSGTGDLGRNDPGRSALPRRPGAQHGGGMAARTSVLAASAGSVPLRGRPLTHAWVATVTVAEFLGFMVPAAVGALTASAGVAVVVPTLLIAGMIEGAVLGSGQAAVLRRAVPRLPSRQWIGATAAAAVLAYAIGLIPSTFAIDRWPLPLAIGFAVIGGAVLLASIGTAQWFVLRHYAAGAGRWIWVTAVAWSVGLLVFLGFAMPLWQPGQPLWLIVAIGVAGGLLMAATTSLITGIALGRLLRGYRRRATTTAS